ncbi:MAG: YfhO family protein [Prevotella sp.]|nr:YfhO family protein [Prevotella sp.]
MKNWKLWLPDVLVVVLFVTISFAYFFPADIEGRILYRHDASAGRGAGQEAMEYYQRTGERTRWTNALFGGMPTYQLSPSYHSTELLSEATKTYHLWLPENVWYVFAYLLGFYILLRAFDFRQHLAALGAIVWAFSSYFFIIIAAGHIWKVMALAYLPPMIAGVVLAFRGKYLWGMLVTAVFGAFEVLANHVQMTYYYLFVILAMVVAFFIDGLRKKEYKHLLKATAACLGAAAIAVCLNLSNLYHTWQYSQESMRGKSELVKQNAENQTSSGLDRDYITQWSYGIDETWTLLIPNAKGGSHHIHLNEQQEAMKKCDPELADYVGQWYLYWGDQPFTAGPVYVGAFVLMLFFLGLFIVKGPMKWALLAVTVLSILLSWGHNFMPMTDFFIDYVPMYAKFRTVSSILVIAEFTIPLLAMLALKEFIKRRKEGEGVPLKYVWISFALTAGFATLFALMPAAFFDFTSFADVQQLRSMLPEEYLSQFLENIAKVRLAVFTADCWRTVLIVCIGTAILLAYRYKKLQTSWMVGLLLVLCLIDMWQVNKRYLNDQMFVSANLREAPMPKSDAIEHILKDTSLDYRVLNLASDTFNENETSFYLKSIGGYHAAKLRRYQELVNAYIQPEINKFGRAFNEALGDMKAINGDSIFPVLNMLNTKYIIVPLQSGKLHLENPYTYGNAWFVDHLYYVSTANEELDKIGQLALRHEAVADKKFEPQLGKAIEQDTLSVVRLKAYEPNLLTYEVNSGKGGVVVFSEIYYPGWTATIDGEEQELGRVNYVLRALQVKPGKHEIVLSFTPKSITHTETIAYMAYAVLVIILLIVLWMEIRRRR